MKTLWFVQVFAVLRLEMRKTFFARRGLWIYLLAIAPLVIFAGHSIIELKRGKPCNFGEDTNIFATVFQIFQLRLVIFFGCLGIFMNLFRGEVLDKSLHFYFLAPVRREVLLMGKYLAGLLAAMVIFTMSTMAQLAALYAHFPAQVIQSYLETGNGWAHVSAYIGVTALACLGYGSVFLAAGALFRNPIVPAAAILVWESINAFVPALLQKFSVIYYLKSLVPIDVPPQVGPPFSLLTINADPISARVAIPGILLFTLLVLVIAAFHVRRMEIEYGAD
jgi:ABC-type transport system involved in multi-copper enzyme maturation permease subunit